MVVPVAAAPENWHTAAKYTAHGTRVQCTQRGAKGGTVEAVSLSTLHPYPVWILESSQVHTPVSDMHKADVSSLTVHS